MRDDQPISNSEIAFDPANPNAPGALSFSTDPVNVAIALQCGKDIAAFCNPHLKAKGFQLDAQMIAADLVALHCNGRPQDFTRWRDAPITVKVAEYASVYYNFDRRTGKLPDFVRLQFDKTA